LAQTIHATVIRAQVIAIITIAGVGAAIVFVKTLVLDTGINGARVVVRTLRVSQATTLDGAAVVALLAFAWADVHRARIVVIAL